MIEKFIRRLVPACILAGGLLFGIMVAFAQADTPIVDLSANEENFRVMGQNALDWLGEMTTGDVNADGIPDLIVGASGYDAGAMINAGAVYVIFGSANLSGTLNLDAESADITFHGYQAGGIAGHVVASGDPNGDGYADIIIGADLLDDGGRTDTGAVFVIYGPITEPVTTPISLDDSNWVDLTIYGQAASERFGRAVATGDVNGDGTDDLAGGAYRADRPEGADCGRTYVFYGSGTLSGTIDLNAAPASADVTITGTTGSRLGRSIATGDVDGDSVDDLIIGAYYADPGEVALIYGSNTLSATIDLSTTNITGQGLGLRVRGVNTGDGFGFFVGAGNINGDQDTDTGVGYADILVSAYLGGSNEDGRGYTLYGGPEITAGVTITSGTWTVPISDCADITLYPADTGDRLGRSVASGDLNADGYDDFVIGASHADPDGRSNAGETYVFYGGTHLSSTITISPTGNTDLTVLGELADDEAGRSTAAGDLNGDGVADLIVGAVLASNNVGEVYVIWGPAATAISMTSSADVVEAGDPVTFTVTARNRYTQTWDVSTYTTTYTSPAAASGTWAGNVYTTQAAGTWTITATHRGLTATTLITVNNPTAVTLASFAAVRRDGDVLVTWETATELDNLGFNLYRSASSAGPWEKLNTGLIPTKNPGAVLGAVYEWLDADAPSGVPSYYRLEAVDVHNAHIFYDPLGVLSGGQPSTVKICAFGAGNSAAGIVSLLFSATAGSIFLWWRRVQRFRRRMSR